MVCHIREKYTINKNTLLRRYIKPEDVEKYVSGEYDAVRGCISREGDYNDVGDFEDIFETFRLDYDNTPYPSTDKSYWKIEFKTTNKELKKINLDNTYGYELGGNNTLHDPCTQNAFTGSKNGKVIPEWNLENGIEYDDNALITKIEHGKVVKQYKFDDGTWRKIK